MKFEIDTDKKTIRLKEDVKLSDLVQELKDLLDRDWENYTLLFDDFKLDSPIPKIGPPNIGTPKEDPDNPYTIIC